MIITCPQCATRFAVPSTIFMKGGRTVRCAVCKHQWFQEPPTDEDNENYIQSDAQKGDVSAKNKIDGEKSSGKGFIATLKNDVTSGYLYIIFGLLIVLAGFFGYMQLKPSLIMGQGLAFEDVQIERDGHYVSGYGRVVNMMDDNRGVPDILVTRVHQSDIEGDSLHITPQKRVLAPDEDLVFDFELPNLESDVSDIRITFVGAPLLKDKTHGDDSGHGQDEGHTTGDSVEHESEAMHHDEATDDEKADHGQSHGHH